MIKIKKREITQQEIEFFMYHLVVRKRERILLFFIILNAFVLLLGIWGIIMIWELF